MPSDAREKTGSPEAETPPPGRFFDPYGSWFGSLRCPGNRDVPNSCKRAEKTPLSGWKAVFLWLRGLDLNQRPPGYELRPDAQAVAPQCFPGLFRPEIPKNPKVVLFRSTGIFGILGHILGQVFEGRDHQNLRRSKEYSGLSEKGAKRSGSSVRAPSAAANPCRL